MWYWIVMAVLVIGCIALLSGTFFSIKKNKAEEAAERAEARKKKRKSQGNAEEAQQPGNGAGVSVHTSDRIDLGKV